MLIPSALLRVSDTLKTANIPHALKASKGTYLLYLKLPNTPDRCPCMHFNEEGDFRINTLEAFNFNHIGKLHDNFLLIYDSN